MDPTLNQGANATGKSLNSEGLLTFLEVLYVQTCFVGLFVRAWKQLLEDLHVGDNL